MNDVREAAGLTIPPTEIEIAELLRAVSLVSPMGMVLRRLVFQRDSLLSPADDDEPITAEFLASVGFERDSFGCYNLMPWGALGKRLSWLDPKFNDAWEGEVTYESERWPKPLKTRGDVRKLCDVLGIKLKDKPTCTQ